MTERASQQESVRGERDRSPVSLASSVASRVSSILAIGLMCLLGVGMLTWYYAHAIGRRNRPPEGAQSFAMKRAQGDLPLPDLGRVDPPPPPPADLPASSAVSGPANLHDVPLEASPTTAAAGSPQLKTAFELRQERELSGAAYAGQNANPTAASGTVIAAPPSAGYPEAGELPALLRSNVSASVRAQVLPTQRLLLPKGAFIDCTLETAIDSTLPGMTTCIMATDSFGADGQVVLLERGTKLIGETRGQVQQGSARVFVVWTEARTPQGVIVPLASPGTDELGRSGLPGAANNHFWQRFGAAMLVSVIDGAVEGAVQAARGNDGTVIVNPSASQGVLTEVLKGTVGIPPTVVKRQGDRIQVLVARDLDFRSVYELLPAAPDR